MDVIELTILPEIERDIAEAVACANGSRVAALRQMPELVEADGQVAILATKRKGGVCRNVSNGSTPQTGSIVEWLTGVTSASPVDLHTICCSTLDGGGDAIRILGIYKRDGLPMKPKMTRKRHQSTMLFA